MDLRERIEQRWQEEVAFLKALVRQPSDNPPGACTPHAVLAASLLEELGLEVERHPVPEDLVRRHGMQSVTNLVVRRRFGAGRGPTIALNAHGDVVPPGDGWTADPYGAEERGGAIYGRGAAVSKSDFATYAFALLALEDEAGLDGTVELHLTYDEEAGGYLGPKWLLDTGLSEPDYAISAGFSYAIVTAHNGCLHLEATIRGRQAHAAMPETGADALEAASDVLAALYGHRRALSEKISEVEGVGSPKLTVGLISGGINTNVVPDRVTLRIDRRIIPEENGEDVEAHLMGMMKEAAAGRAGISVETRRIMLAEPLRPLAGTERLVDAISRHAGEIIRAPVVPQGVPLYTDARHYAAAGIPTVLYGAGPRSILEANAHGADEHIRLDDLGRATEIIALTLRDLLRH